MVDGVVNMSKSAAVVFSGDAQGGTWRVRMAIASFIKHGIPKERIFMLTSPDFADEYVAANATCLDVSGIVRGTLGISKATWPSQHGGPYGMSAKLTIPLVPELSGFATALSVDPDVLCHSVSVSRLLAYPCHGYEAVGGAFYSYGTRSPVAGLTLSEHRARMLRDVLSDEDYRDLQLRVLSDNPLEDHVWACDGVFLMNLRRIRDDIPWYLRRVAMWYQGAGRFFSLNTEDFCNVFLDSAALLPQHLLVHAGGTVPSLDRDCRPAVIHYGHSGCIGGPCGGTMVSAARGLDLDPAVFEVC